MAGVVRKRDRLRNFFGRSGGTSPARATPPYSQASASQASHPTPPHRSFSEKAVLSLAPDEQALVRRHLAGNAGDIDGAVREAYDSAIRQRQACEDKRLRVKFRGRDVVLRDEADTVVRWLRRFAVVGDVVANVDPLHVGLPWAGIRLILEVAGIEGQQMAALLSGMNLIMYMANRLRAYLTYLMHLPDTDTTLTFEKALVKMYAVVLKFLDEAVECCKKGSVARIWDALWNESALDGFENDCNSWAMHVALDVANCDRELAQQNEHDARQWRGHLQDAVRNVDDTLRDIQDSLASLHMKNDLAKLVTVPQAVYNSLDEERLARCLPGTRTALLQQILDWTGDAGGKRVFWLSGMAGTGKSVVSRTVAHMLDQQRQLGTTFCIGVSFFFKRGEGDRADASRVFPTIAMQLADIVPGLGALIADVLSKDSFLNTKSLRQQFEQLIMQPLVDVSQRTSGRWNIIIVLDALDECGHTDDIATLLTQLARIGTITSVNIRLFVTSRPELPIQLEFETMSKSLYDDIRLEEVQAATIEHDIRKYLGHEMGRIKSEMVRRRPYDEYDADWPGKENLDRLVKAAIPLFIFASTLCRFVADDRPDYNPQEHLQSILQHRTVGAHAGIEKTYLPILERVILGTGGKDRETAIAKFKDVVGPIVLLASPLSIPMLSNLLGIPPGDVYERLENLRSVLSVPRDRDLPVQLLHKSFADFLVHPEDESGNPFSINRTQTHKRLFLRCLRVLSQPNSLRENMCGLSSPGTRMTSISRERIKKCIPPDIAYACSFWPFHLAESGEVTNDHETLLEFLETHFLHWVETLTWLGRLFEARVHIFTLQVKFNVIRDVHGGRGSQLQSFLHHANNFLHRNEPTIIVAPLQLYSSALCFTPKGSVIKQMFAPKHSTAWLQSLPDAPPTQTVGTDKLVFGRQHFQCITLFSPGGQTLARWWIGEDRVRLWRVATGEELQSLEGPQGGFEAVVFSHDGKIVATGSDNTALRLWDVNTGEVVRKLEVPSSGLGALAFSVDGKLFALSSKDTTVRLWSIATGEEIRKLEGVEGHADWIQALTFSHDGRLLATGSAHETVRIWDMVTGEVQELEGQEGILCGLAFSPNGLMLAAGYFDSTVRIWDATTGDVIQKLEGLGERVAALAFSHNGRILATSSHDKFVRLWDVKAGKEMHSFSIRRMIYRLAFTHDDRILETDAGLFDIRLYTHVSASVTGSDNMPRLVTMDAEWLNFADLELLLLPPPNWEGSATIQGQSLVIIETGDVSFYRIDTSELVKEYGLHAS